MQIHNVIEDQDQRWEVDPMKGPIRVAHSIVRASDVHTLSHGGKTYKVDKASGSFDVPVELGREMIRRSGWFEGPGIPILPTPEELEAVSTGKGETKPTETKPETKA